MLILLPKESTENLGHRSVAVNLKSYDEIVINKIEDNVASLVLVKHHDGHASNQSASFYILGTFPRAEDCYTLWQEIVQALKDRQATFELPDTVPPESLELAGQTNRKTGFL